MRVDATGATGREPERAGDYPGEHQQPAGPYQGRGDGGRGVRSTKSRHCGIAEKLSNAVDPSNTASTATVPGRTGSDGR